MNRGCNRLMGVLMIALLVWAVPVLAESPTYGDDESWDTNYLYLTLIDDQKLTAFIDYIDFRLEEYCITNSGDWGGVSVAVVAPGDGTTKPFFLVRANRHGSQAVADWFNARVGRAVATDSPQDDPYTARPDELNFAFKGTLTLGIVGNAPHGGAAVFENVVIGQGHRALRNNWWIGGRDATVKVIEYGGNNVCWMLGQPTGGKCGGTLIITPDQVDSFKLDIRMCPNHLTEVLPHR